MEGPTTAPSIQPQLCCNNAIIVLPSAVRAAHPHLFPRNSLQHIRESGTTNCESTHKGKSPLFCFTHSWKHVRESNIYYQAIFLYLERLKNSNSLIIPHTPISDILPICPHPLILLFSFRVHYTHHRPSYDECLMEASHPFLPSQNIFFWGQLLHSGGLHFKSLISARSSLFSSQFSETTVKSNETLQCCTTKVVMLLKLNVSWQKMVMTNACCATWK